MAAVIAAPLAESAVSAGVFLLAFVFRWHKNRFTVQGFTVQRFTVLTLNREPETLNRFY
jgi:hypothetical protein